MNINDFTFQKFDKKYLNDLVELWNKEIYKKEIYAEFTIESFTEKYLNNPNYDNDGTVLVLKGSEFVGFGCAAFYKGTDATSPGFITCLFVKIKYRRHGIGTKILNLLEDYLKQNGKTMVRNYFGAPMNLKWYIPGTKKHEHMGCPAVPFNTSYYLFLLANGYNVNGQHDGYHIDLRKFKLSNEIKERLKSLKEKGYTITLYDENKHFGWDSFFDELQNEGFRNSVKRTLQTPYKNKLVIVENHGRICGFTGPVHIEETGRASLNGVAIDPRDQKIGLGKAMFCMLCKYSKDAGGKYMTLFTGADNRARNIYLYAGLRVAQSFVIMKKEF